MRTALLVGIGGILLVAAVLVLLWQPSDEDPTQTLQPTTTPLNQDHTTFPLDERGPFSIGPESSEPEESTDVTPEEMIAPTGDAETEQDLRESELSNVTNISMGFFDDLAEQLVTGYLPPGSVANPTPRGRLNIHFSALNRRYGLELVGLDHQSASLIEGRQEIFTNLLQPEAVETVWMLFHPFFEYTLDEALRSATWSFPTQDGTPVSRALTVQEQQDYYRLLSASIATLAQAVQSYALNSEAVELTENWLQGQTTAYAAHSRYQQAESALETAIHEAPTDQLRILDERLERDAAAQGIMQAITARENARQELLAAFQTGRSKPELTDAELLYISEWLWRRIHEHPARMEAFVLLSDKLREMAMRLEPGRSSPSLEPIVD